MDAEFRTKTVHRHEVVLRAPSVLGELDKAIRFAQAKFEQVTGRKVHYDNEIHVQADDDGIVLWFETSTTREG